MRPSRSTLLPLLGCLVLGLPSGAALAAEDASPTTIAIGPAVPETLPAPPVPDAPDQEAIRQAMAERAAYEQSIAALEVNQGVYGAELSEAYMGLGTTLRKLELHAEAAEAFGKALQSLRISFGLADPRQLPVLEELRSTNETLEDWDEVHAMNHLIFHIAKQNAEAGEELRVKALLQLGAWLQRADAEDLVSDFQTRADDLSKLYNHEIERLEQLEAYEGKSIQLASLYLDLATVELTQAKRKYEMPISAFQTPAAGEQRSVMTQQCFTTLDRNGRSVTYCNEPIEVPNLNYYLAPNSQKNSEIREHLSEVESKVMAAYHTLQEESDPSDLQTTLLEEVHRLTSEYNAFVSINPK